MQQYHLLGVNTTSNLCVEVERRGTHLCTSTHTLLSLYTGFDCRPEIMAFSAEKFLSIRSSCNNNRTGWCVAHSLLQQDMFVVYTQVYIHYWESETGHVCSVHKRVHSLLKQDILVLYKKVYTHYHNTTCWYCTHKCTLPITQWMVMWQDNDPLIPACTCVNVTALNTCQTTTLDLVSQHHTPTAPLTCVNVTAPRTCVSVTAPRTCVSVTAPRTYVSVTAPRTCVSVTAPLICVSVTAPRTCVSVTAPRTCVSVTAPRTCVSVTAPRTCAMSIHLSMMRARWLLGKSGHLSMIAIKRYDTALNWFTVAYTEGASSRFLSRPVHTQPMHWCGTTRLKSSCNIEIAH